MSSKKVTISNHAKGLTCQAGLVPVVKFLRKIGMISLIVETVDHERGANALYDSVDAVFLKAIAKYRWKYILPICYLFTCLSFIIIDDFYIVLIFSKSIEQYAIIVKASSFRIPQRVSQVTKL